MNNTSLIRFLADEARRLVLSAERSSALDAKDKLLEAGELTLLAANIAAREDRDAFKIQEAA